MPRRTPIKELQNEESTVSSPLRRSSRISNNSPVPTKVTTRRSSATETPSTSAPKMTKGRRASFSQELEANNEKELEAKNSKVTSTPRQRRGSFSSKTSENSVSEDETVTKRSTRGSSVVKEQSSDVKKPSTRRRRSVSQEVEISEEAPTPKATRGRSSSITKKNEKADKETSEVNSTEESEALNSEVANIMKKSSSTETVNKTLEAIEEVNKEFDSLTEDESKLSTMKKKKTDKLKVDLDLSVINEASLTEDDIISSEGCKSPLPSSHAETVKEDKLENPLEVNSSQVEETVKDTSAENSIANEITTQKPLETEYSSSTTEKSAVNNESKSGVTSSTLEENVSKKENTIMQTSDALTSDGSFNLQLSSSVLESSNKNEANGNISPFSNKENIRPDEKPTEQTCEPMDVDESYFENTSFGNLSKIQSPTRSPIPASPKSTTVANVSEELRIAGKVADEIDQFLKEETKFESSSKSKRSRLSLKSSSYKDKNTSENVIEELKKTEELVEQNEETTIKENGTVDNVSMKEETSSPSSEENVKEYVPTSVIKEVCKKKEDTVVLVEDESDESIHLEVTDDSLLDRKIVEITKESITENAEEEVVSKEDTEKVITEDIQGRTESTSVLESKDDKLEENIEEESRKETEKTQNDHLEQSMEINVELKETIDDIQQKIIESSTLEKTDNEVSQNKDEGSPEEIDPEDDIPQLVSIISAEKERLKDTEELLPSESLNNKEITTQLDKSSQSNTETDKADDLLVNKDNVAESPQKEESVKVLKTSLQELKGDVIAEDAESKEKIVEKSMNISIEKECVEKTEVLKKSPQIIIKSDILIQASVCKEVTKSSSTKEVVNETFTKSNDEVSRKADVEQEVCSLDTFTQGYKSPQKKVGVRSRMLIDCTNSSSEEELDELNEDKRKSVDQKDVTDSKYDIVTNTKGRTETIKVEENTSESPDVVVLSDNEDKTVDIKNVPEIPEEQVLVSSDGENEVKEVSVVEAAKVASSSIMSDKKHSLDKTSIVMQGNIKAGEDKERRLSDRIHKVVDLFCAGIKNNSDVSVNVSLEYTGHFSDSDKEASPKKDIVEVTLTAQDQKQTSNLKGSKRRKLYNPEAEYALVQHLGDRQEQEIDSEQKDKNNKNETSTQINNKKKKKKKSATFSESDISIPSPQTSKRSPSARQEGEDFTSPVKKQRMYKDTPYKSAKSSKKSLVNNKEGKEEREKIPNRESENDDKITKGKIKSSEEFEQKDNEEKKKNDEKSLEWKPFSKYFSSVSESESEIYEDDNDTTWAPSREIDVDDTILSSEEEEEEQEEEDRTSDILEEEEDASDVFEEEEESPALIIRSPIQQILHKERKSKQSGSSSGDNAEVSFTCTSMKKSDLFSSSGSSSSESDVFNSTTISTKSASPKVNKELIQSQILKVEEVGVEEKKKQKKDFKESTNNDKQKERTKVISKENKKPSPINSKEELAANEKKPKKRRHATYVMSEEESVVVKKPNLVSQKIPKIVVSEVPSSKLQVSKKECQKTIHSKQSSKKSGKAAKATYLKPSTTMSSCEWDVKIL